MQASLLVVRSYYRREHRDICARARIYVMRALQIEAMRKKIALQLGCIASAVLFYSWIGIADANARTLAHLVLAYQNTNKEVIAVRWIVNATPSTRFPYKK